MKATKNITVKFATLIISALFVSACGMTDTMDEMSDTTRSMKGTTEDMKRQTEVLLRDARQGGAVKTRTDHRNNLLYHDESIELKFVDAAIYFQAFEFQIWENILTDDEAHRQNLLRDGSQEFMTTLSGFIGGARPVPNPLSSKAQMKNLFALAATVDQVNTIQIEASARNPFQVVSMLDLITKALKSRGEVDLKQLPDSKYKCPVTIAEYICKVLINEDEAMYLLELRYNIMPAMVLAKIYDVNEMGLLDKLKMLLSKKDMLVDFTKLNAAEINEMNHNYLASALAMRTLRAELGAPINMHKNVLKILKKAAFKDDPLAGAGKAAAIANFKTSYDKLIKEPGAAQ